MKTRYLPREKESEKTYSPLKTSVATTSRKNQASNTSYTKKLLLEKGSKLSDCFYETSREEGKDQKLIQLSTTPDTGHHMGR